MREEEAAMDRQKDIVIRVEQVSKLYGMNKSEAVKMMASGSGKDEVYKKTGAPWPCGM